MLDAKPHSHAFVAPRGRGIGRPVDPLSLMLDDIRLSGAVLTDLDLAPGTAYACTTGGLAMVYIARRGAACVEIPGVPPQVLQPSELMLVTAGEGPHRVSLPNDRSAPGQDIADMLGGRLVPARLENATAEATCGRFRYDADQAAPLMAALPPIMRFQGAGSDAPPWLVIGLGFLEQELASPKPASQAVINRLLDILLVECLRDQIERIPPDAAGWLATLRDPPLSAVLTAMHQDPARTWTATDLAAIAHMSRSAFASRFSTALGQSPIAYLTQLRLRIAMRQLRHSARPIKTIAHGLGWGSTVGFNQAFRKAFGVPPSAVRGRQHAAHDDEAPPGFARFLD